MKARIAAFYGWIFDDNSSAPLWARLFVSIGTLATGGCAFFFVGFLLIYVLPAGFTAGVLSIGIVLLLLKVLSLYRASECGEAPPENSRSDVVSINDLY